MRDENNHSCQLVTKVGQIGPKWAKSGIFSDRISVHFGTRRHNVLKSDLKKTGTIPILAQFDPLWGQTVKLVNNRMSQITEISWWVRCHRLRKRRCCRRWRHWWRPRRPARHTQWSLSSSCYATSSVSGSCVQSSGTLQPGSHSDRKVRIISSWT